MRTQKTLELSEYLTSAALVASGIALLEVKPPSGYQRRCALVFSDEGGRASRTLAEHRAGDLMVNSLRYAAAVNDLKGRIFSARG